MNDELAKLVPTPTDDHLMLIEDTIVNKSPLGQKAAVRKLLGIYKTMLKRKYQRL